MSEKDPRDPADFIALVLLQCIRFTVRLVATGNMQPKLIINDICSLPGIWSADFITCCNVCIDSAKGQDGRLHCSAIWCCLARAAAPDAMSTFGTLACLSVLHMLQAAAAIANAAINFRIQPSCDLRSSILPYVRSLKLSNLASDHQHLSVDYIMSLQQGHAILHYCSNSAV